MKLVALFIRFFTGVTVRGDIHKEKTQQRIYFCNHTSHFDFAIIWSVLPSKFRRQTKAAVAVDYWCANKIRRMIVNIFSLIPIERLCVKRSNNPLLALEKELNKGNSLIIFPEGSRANSADVINSGDTLREFKGGIYHLAKKCPHVELIPIYINNANRILPKGEFLPVPFICSVSIGEPIKINDHESKKEFLLRARNTLETLRAS